jgi:hypothetical protein
MVFENPHTVSRGGARDRLEVQPKVLDTERFLYCALQGKAHPLHGTASVAGLDKRLLVALEDLRQPTGASGTALE